MPAVSTNSFRARIEDLEIGESFTFTTRLDQDEATRADILDAETKVANMARGQMARAKKGTRATYTGDLLDARTRTTRDPVILYVVTRTA